MSLDGVLITDVSRITTECCIGFFFLVAGPKGSGKTFVLRSFRNGVVSGTGRGTEAPSVAELLVRRSEGAAALASCLRVCSLDFCHVRREAHVIAAMAGGASSDELVFSPGSVLVVDDLEALWTLCVLNGELPTLQLLLKRLLASPACALVASARSEDSVPTTVLEWRRPVTYLLPALTPASARRAIRAGFGSCGENGFEGMDDCVSAIPLAGATRGSLLLALCLAKETAEGAPLSVKDDDGTIEEYLQWLESGHQRLGRGEEVAASLSQTKCEPLYGLEQVRSRAEMLISVFANAGAACNHRERERVVPAGSVAAALRGTTGILLHGPSGCGKTAMARQLSSAFPDVAFFFVQCTALFSKYLGESEERLRHIYRKARARAPSVVVLDDVDVIAQSRGAMSSSSEESSRGGVNVDKRMLAGLLCELDGVTDNSGVLTIATTNAPEVLDSALLRQGRLETLLLVPPLTQPAAAAMADHFFAAFDGPGDRKREMTCTVSHAAVDCSPASLRFVLRKLLESVLATSPAELSASPIQSDSGGCATKSVSLPLPSTADVETVLSETSSMLRRCSYTFDVQAK